jgi:hypothetical protein
MARFYASISGKARTVATRTGTPDTGITGHVRGWNVGVRVDGGETGGVDEFDIYSTGGSNSPTDTIYLGTVRRTDFGKIVFIPANI